MHADYAKSAEFISMCFTLALEGSQTSLRQESAESLSTPSPSGLPLSQGEKVGDCVSSFQFPVYFVPLRQGRRGAKRRMGWINRSPLIRSPLKSSFQFSPLPPSQGGPGWVHQFAISHAYLSSCTTHSVLCLIVRRPVSCCHWLVPEPCELPGALYPPGSAYRRCSPALPASCSL